MFDFPRENLILAENKLITNPQRQAKPRDVVSNFIETKMKPIILIFSIAILQSCVPDCKKLYLKEADKVWFSNYKIGDKLIFKSQYNDFDTIHITNKVITKPTGDCKVFVSNYMAEFVRIDYEMKKDTFDLIEDYFIQISAEDENKNAIPVIRLLNMEYSNFGHKSLKAKPSEINSNWKSIYTFNKANCPYTDLNADFGLTEFEWDKSYGLVTYKNVKGEKWILIKKE